jgi:MoaA/NifB/PqqE/SkfB family radical SAM enzyme
MERQLQSMHPDTFDIVERFVTYFESDGGLTTVILHKDGEPFLCPYFPNYFARIADKTTAKIDVYTNGTLMKPEMVKFMSDNTVKNKNKIWLLVTFHCFDKNGNPYDLTKVEKNLRDCLDLDLPRVEFIISMHKLDQTDEKFTQDFHAKWSNVRQQKPQLKAIHVNTCINHWAGRVNNQKDMAHYDACPYMDASHLFIGVTGNVMPCCMDMEEEIVFGNVALDAWSDIMEKREKFYVRLRDREVPHPLCSQCLK